MKRTEAVALLKELGIEHLIQPTFVIFNEENLTVTNWRLKAIMTMN
jgi:hypothetical protein